MSEYVVDEGAIWQEAHVSVIVDDVDGSVWVLLVPLADSNVLIPTNVVAIKVYLRTLFI